MNRLICLLLALMLVPLAALADDSLFETIEPLSRGEEVDLLEHLAPGQPTVFIFTAPTSTLEEDYVRALLREITGRAGWELVYLSDRDTPIARRYQITKTPTVLIYDRRGRFVERGSDTETIQQALSNAARVMRIDWPEAGDRRYEELRRRMGPGIDQPSIMRTMSFQPEYMMAIGQLAQRAHFSDGFLPRRVKELIATYVSAINKCRY